MMVNLVMMFSLVIMKSLAPLLQLQNLLHPNLAIKDYSFNMKDLEKEKECYVEQTAVIILMLIVNTVWLDNITQYALLNMIAPNINSKLPRDVLLPIYSQARLKLKKIHLAIQV